ncbi:MAG: type II toxin-antitoxin system YafQ family toxin [Acidobacteria bacterium]|nr:type II toxin-antitoxin system YafQ family toxin [Acidobacteriota bacterium]
MRTIERTSQFKRDYKRESRGRRRASLDDHLASIVEVLANDQPLQPRHHDHALSGEWSDHRDCHVKPDLILIYQKPDDDTLRLVRLGSHSELGF